MKILENEPLAKHTTFHLGGEARYFIEVENIEELEEALSLAKEKDLPYFILGGGSNVVANDEGYEGVVIRVMNNELRIEGKYIEVGAGVSLAKVVSECERRGLTGLRWAWGIPGTIGGAIRGNAGAYGGEMKDSVVSISVVREGKIKKLKSKDCKFGYRESIFKKNKDIIWSVKLRLNNVGAGLSRPGQVAGTAPLWEKIKKERRDKFSGGYSAGSFFKNTTLKNKTSPAAWLIDRCDLKGFCIGDICVSDKHAGILLNRGKGTSDELRQLVSLIKQRVRDRFGIELQEEIEYLG